MGRPATKTDLLTAAANNYEKLNILVSGLTEKELLNWVYSNQNGDNKPFLPEPYNWKTYGDMNVEFWKKHQSTSLEDAKNMFQKSHNEVINLAETFSNEELFSKGVYKWVGGSTLGSYFVSVTASHYDWAMKKLKAHRKNCA